MAQPTNTFSSYDAVGNREDLSDIITIVDQEKTPFVSSIAGTSRATSRYHEWQTDALDAASAANAAIEGDDITGDSITPSVRVGNRIQLLEKAVTITDLQDMVDKAGRDRELAYQINRKTRSIKRDLEASCLANNASVTGNDTTAAEMGGLASWIETNQSRGATGSAGGFSSGNTTAATDGAQRDFTESLLKDVLLQGANSGANFTDILVGAFNKQQMSSFSGGATRQIDATQKKVVNTIDVYVGDFGEMKVHFAPQIRARDCLILDRDMVNVAYLEELKMFDLAKTGTSTKKAMTMYATVEVLNEKGCAVVADLTTS